MRSAGYEGARRPMRGIGKRFRRPPAGRMGDRSRADGNLAPIGVIIDDPGQFGACHRPIWRT